MSLVSANKKRDLIKELFKVGAHFGYSRSRRHPSATPFIFGFKNRTAVIDLEKAEAQLETAKAFVASIAASGKKVLLVGTKPEARAPLTSVAEDLAMPYVAGRWLGGTLTNFSQMKKRMERLAELKADKEKGGFARFTKREQSRLAKEMSDLERYFGTLTSLKEMPGVMVVIDSREEEIAVSEAKKLGVPVVSLSGTDCNLNLVTYPVVGNDAQVASIKFFLEEIGEAYKFGIIQASAPTNHDEHKSN